ncbi:MAG TPA: hypothetical protein VFJ13_12365 [Paracoccaceae bacterium]|nr:hypothetical protein [Paracoccaceae bacterium]
MAGDPAALILDVSGTIEPEIGLYEEVGDGTVLKLGPDASLTISHYGACEEVALTGGTVTVGAGKLAIDGGEILSRTDVQCPGQIVMAAADLINMAVTLRSVERARLMAPRPEFVLAGKWGRQFDKLDIYDREGHIAMLPVSGGHAGWPAELAPLAIGGTYVVVLNGPGAKQHAARIEVSGDPLGMTVLKGR